MDRTTASGAVDLGSTPNGSTRKQVDWLLVWGCDLSIISDEFAEVQSLLLGSFHCFIYRPLHGFASDNCVGG